MAERRSADVQGNDGNRGVGRVTLDAGVRAVGRRYPGPGRQRPVDVATGKADLGQPLGRLSPRRVDRADQVEPTGCARRVPADLRRNARGGPGAASSAPLPQYCSQGKTASEGAHTHKRQHMFSTP